MVIFKKERIQRKFQITIDIDVMLPTFLKVSKWLKEINCEFQL